jgi:uncharacterized protein involved in exopolysaccharide biosynthesis
VKKSEAANLASANLTHAPSPQCNPKASKRLLLLLLGAEVCPLAVVVVAAPSLRLLMFVVPLLPSWLPGL